MEGENLNNSENQKKIEEDDLSLGNEENINLNPDVSAIEDEAPVAPETETKSEEQLMKEKEKEIREKTTLWKTYAAEFMGKIGKKDIKSDIIGEVFRMTGELRKKGVLEESEKRAMDVLTLLLEKYNKIEQMRREVSDYSDRRQAEKEKAEHDALMGKIGGI